MRQLVQQNYIPKHGTFHPENKVSANVFLSLDHKVEGVPLGGLITSNRNAFHS